jgi:hypothetical protein
MIEVGWFGDPMNSGAGNRDREGKVTRGQSARDVAGWRTSSRPNHEAKYDREQARKAARKEKRAAAQAENGSSLCSAILLASALSAAGLASQYARLKGWAA